MIIFVGRAAASLPSTLTTPFSASAATPSGFLSALFAPTAAAFVSVSAVPPLTTGTSVPSVGAPTYVLAPASAPTIPTSTIFSASAPYSITFSAFLFNVTFLLHIFCRWHIWWSLVFSLVWLAKDQEIVNKKGFIKIYITCCNMFNILRQHNTSIKNKKRYAEKNY